MKTISLYDKLFKVAVYVFCIVVMVITGFPLFFLLANSFKGMPEYMKNVWLFPKHIYFGNYQAVLKPSFLRYFLNSFIVSASGVMIIFVCGSLMSFAFSKFNFKFLRALYFIVIAGMMIPIHTTLIPIYTMSNQIGTYNTRIGLILPYVSFNLPVSVFIMTQFFRESPKEFEEAAMIDGASKMLFFRKILVPLSASAFSTVGIYTFLNMWNEFMYALVLIDATEKKTLSLGIRDFYGFMTVNITAVLTAILVGSLPVLIFYFVAQDKVINGLTQGAIKG
ncbi:MAG: carbohydrate ABC transporter permease [Sphaerochaetaceae bacterium]